MKRAFFLLLAFLTSGNLLAQSSPNKPVPESLEFVPNTIFAQPDAAFSFENSVPPTKQGKFLFTTGWVLRGLKYNSITDEFASFPPFYEDAFTPRTFSELNSLVTTNYLLIHKH